MPKVIANLFPTLVGIAMQMMQPPHTTGQDTIPAMLHLILGTYNTVHFSAESIVSWGQLLFAVINLQIPRRPDAVQRIGRVPSLRKPVALPSAMQAEYMAFAQHFVTVFAPEVLAIYLRQIKLYNLNTNVRAVAAVLDGPDFVVRVQAALALHESVKKAFKPQVGKVTQDLLKLADKRILDILNHRMVVIGNAFQTELLPRRGAAYCTTLQCGSYMHLIKESLAAEQTAELGDATVDAVSAGDENKTYAGMGVVKTIATVKVLAQVQ
ncbi:Importin N-terminal domain-containing protein [Mycena chlorophos]|uniref:Importin N-terminal domain-containing protein n=1 Tax=Mycena chlorophos TaxID=658473 RepID=A0A8H6SH76_MYCCL|nr:Importin N-terminal domain-containing protein [Mycena chlorophos]